MRIRPILLAWCYGALIACTANQEALEQGPPIGNPYDNTVAKRENQILREHPDVVARWGGELKIKLASGRFERFEDVPACVDSDACLLYRLYGYDIGNRTYTISEQHYEGRTISLVDQLSGARIDLDDVPHVSPNGSYWAVADPDYAYGSGDIVIVERDERAFKVQTKIGGRYCEFDRWLDDISFRAYCPDSSEGGFNIDRLQETIIQRNELGEWTERETGKAFTANEVDRLVAPE